MQVVARTFSAAMDLIANNSAGPTTRLLEVNPDGSIRTQNWKEKLANFGSRLIRTYQARKDAKDAAVVDAFNALVEKAKSGIDPREKMIWQMHERSGMQAYGFMNRYLEAWRRLRDRDATIVPQTTSPIRRDSVASLHAQGGATTNRSDLN
jgi:hypothetical protein